MSNPRKLHDGGTPSFFSALIHNPVAAVLGSHARSIIHLQKGRNGGNITLGTLVRRIYSEFSEDRVLAVAGGITFFFLLALFPAIACVVSLYGVFDDRVSLHEGLQMASGFLPGGAVSVLSAEVDRLIAQRAAPLNLTIALSFIVAVWSASGGVKAIIDGLNIAFETEETRSFLKLTLNTIALTLLVAALAAAAIYFSVALRRYIAGQHSHLMETAFNISVWPLGFCFCSAVISLIYRYGPNRVRSPWRWITWGSGLASLFWLLGTWSFSRYAENFGSYDRTYGVLGGVVGFLTWIWLSVVLLLTGAEIVCELDMKRQPKETSANRQQKHSPKHRGK